MRIGAALLLMTCVGCVLGTSGVTSELEPVLRQRLAATAAARLADPAAFRVQVLVSAVETAPGHAPRLTRSAYRLGTEYFYPASAIKLAAAVAALQTIERLGSANGSIDLADTPLEIAPLFAGDRPQQ
jgi:beta-lactamase class A